MKMIKPNLNTKECKDLLEGLQSNDSDSLTFPKYLRFNHAYHRDQILGDPLQGVKTKASLKNTSNNLASYTKKF